MKLTHVPTRIIECSNKEAALAQFRQFILFRVFMCVIAGLLTVATKIPRR